MSDSRTIDLPEPFLGTDHNHDSLLKVILYYFSKGDVFYAVEIALSEYINSRMPAQPKGCVAAWKIWNDWEERDRTYQPDPGLYTAMALCSYCEWCAKFEAGETTEPFRGVPRLTITFQPPNPEP